MSFKITGLDELQRKLRKIRDNAQALDGEHEVSLKELFPQDFLAAHTQFSSVDNMFEKSGYKVDSSEDFAAIPDEPWDEFIRANTSFASWAEMKQAAGVAYAKRKLLGASSGPAHMQPSISCGGAE